MKILLIDQLSPRGHVKYDKYWINILKNLKIDFEFIGRESFLKSMAIDKKFIKLSIPEKYYENVTNKNILIREYALIKLLLYIKSNINIMAYSNIVFLSFENISMFLSMFFHQKKILLILHNNLKHINNKIIYNIVKFLSKSNTLISLDDFINVNLSGMGIENKVIIHPLIGSYVQQNNLKNNEEIIIFSPSITSVDKKILIFLLQDEKLKKILQEKNIKLILRDKELKSSIDNIVILSEFLSEDSYSNLMEKSDIIFLPYEKDFNNRISGVLLEAISLEKSLIIPKYNNLKYFLNFKQENIKGFIDIDELKQILKDVNKMLKRNNYENIKENYSMNKMKEDILRLIEKED
ncbi:hypothetical protein [Fusobacterium sp.]|uniref:hypothetical protein n=1 Tax=Fusobacterium sp. TaxID=68766 RepID=UPI0028FEB252|nr:hypothetical protein [Fusobacterium sp.]MDU1911462.1 hypothetical protein [Fusobacterium sp.]